MYSELQCWTHLRFNRARAARAVQGDPATARGAERLSARRAARMARGTWRRAVQYFT